MGIVTSRITDAELIVNTLSLLAEMEQNVSALSQNVYFSFHVKNFMLECLLGSKNFSQRLTFPQPTNPSRFIVVAFPRSSLDLRHRPLDRPGSSVAKVAQAISCSNVHDVCPVHELFWFCLVQVSTTQFCIFPSFVMARTSDGTDMPVSPLPASSSHIGSPNGSLPDLEGTGYR